MDRHYTQKRTGISGRGLVASGILLSLLLAFSCSNITDNLGNTSSTNTFTSALTPDEELTENNFRLMSTEEILNSQSFFLHHLPASYLLFLPGPLLVSIVFVLKKKKVITFLSVILFLLSFVALIPEETEDILHKANTLYYNGSYREALELFKSKETELPENGPLYYNIALCYDMLKDPGHGIYNLVKAIKIGSVNKQAVRYLKNMERRYNLTSQVNALPYFHDNIPFILLTVFYNLSFLLFTLIKIERRSSLVILFIFCAVFTIFSFTALLLNRGQMSKENGVVITETAVIKKIPLDNAQDWIKLKNGAIVKILGETDRFILIQTGRGLRGWIRYDYLLRD